MMGSVSDGTEKKNLHSKTAEELKAKKEETALRSRSSIKIKGSTALKLLESQGYIVGRTLGSGSYASVKSAYDIKRKHKVAIKIINKKKSFDEYLKKFLPRETQAMQTLGQHYALIRFYQLIETTSRFFFIMELADNGDLLTEIKAKEYIKEDQAGQWFIHLHDGIKFMHSKGLVHRDIKCENLVLNAKNILKITDFGFAKKIGKAKSGGPLLSETFCGSYAYAPPEILKGISYNPEIADVWSMGVVLFTMVYGRLPFDDSDTKKLLKQVQSRVIFPATPEVSEICRLLILKIFAKASDRIPLKNFKADAWFKLQKESKKFEGADDSKADGKQSIDMDSSKVTVRDKCNNENMAKEDTINNKVHDEPAIERTILDQCERMSGCVDRTEGKEVCIKQDDKVTCLSLSDLKEHSGNL
ncbi:testis-specific serine/threonine-protein kinase 4-like [Mercenaria mercenaria]|uniref:testis-specific serine/threonine-protein kinase 4-like n=1 Tax=Mercenaria mercenaria TaxID=6596 RepID=UPI001E1D9248|nr:testis-specific serine/threonine-protein kinase 4-like [Mercenaria mercenaria]